MASASAKLSPAQRRGLIVEYLSRDEPTTARVIWVFAFRGLQRDRECSLGTIRNDLAVLLAAHLVERGDDRGLGRDFWKRIPPI